MLSTSAVSDFAILEYLRTNSVEMKDRLGRSKPQHLTTVLRQSRSPFHKCLSIMAVICVVVFEEGTKDHFLLTEVT